MYPHVPGQQPPYPQPEGQAPTVEDGQGKAGFGPGMTTLGSKRRYVYPDAGSVPQAVQQPDQFLAPQMQSMSLNQVGAILELAVRILT